MKFINDFFLILVILLSTVFVSAKSINTELEDFDKRFDDFIQKVRSDFQIQTGIAVGVVKDGELILQKQYGFLNVKKKTLLEADTPFYIASTTKSFVGLLAVILAEKGFFKLDEPISKYLPELVFADKKLQADKITIRDLLNHVHGISNEIVTFNTAYSGLNISDKNLLEDFQKESSFTNNNFDYSNVGYILTGLIIKKTTGKSWQENLKKYVLKPANLNATSPYVSDFAKNKLPFAHFSFRRENGFAQEPFIKIDRTMHAAGGLLSTVSDAAKWVILHLNQGKYKGVQIFPNKYFAETLKPQTDLKTTFFNYERSQYGLGWYHAKLNKYLMIHSFGSFLGARSHISFLPEHNLGVCVFINESGRGIYVPDMIANYIYGLLLNDENVISATENELTKQTKTFQEAIAKKPPEQPTVGLSMDALRKFVGIYSHQALGKLTVRILNGKIFIELGNIKTFAKPTAKTSFSTDFPYFYRFEFSDIGVQLNEGGKYLFNKVNEQSENTVEVPKGSTVIIDGKINEDEWKDALSQDLKNGGNIKLKHDGEFLQIGLQGGKPGLSHVYLTDGKDVFVFHASAALGMVTYQKGGEVWNTTQKFKWELRDQATNNEGSSAYLKTNGWLASVSPMTANDREYKVSMKFKGSDNFRLVAVYFNNPTSPQFFPNTIADDTLKPQLLFGSEPTNLSFKFEQWATIKLKDFNK